LVSLFSALEASAIVRFVVLSFDGLAETDQPPIAVTLGTHPVGPITMKRPNSEPTIEIPSSKLGRIIAFGGQKCSSVFENFPVRWGLLSPLTGLSGL
jgi:hypothetical protein